MIPRALLLLVPVLLLAVPSAPALAGHYIPQAGDRFDYYETIALGSGAGNYTGYTENTFINGTISVAAVASNGTESAQYSNTNSWRNNQGQAQSWNSAGAFTFSANSYLYVRGTDNQTGYTNPYVWFYVNSSSPVGGRVTVLNSPLQVVSRSASFSLGRPLNEYVLSIFAEGNGSYQRNDVYGVFTATYNWEEYFDPTTGYVVGYVYTEQDSNAAGDGFSVTDLLYVTSTSYALTPGAAPPAPSSPSGYSPTLIFGLVVLVVVIVVLLLVWVVVRARRRTPLARH